MTIQTPETLRYEGEDVSMYTEPLDDYFTMAGVKPRFAAGFSALWRGYVGRWEIDDGRLYLVGLGGTLEDGTAASVATLFPNSPDRVFAHWYSGTLRIPQGEELSHVHLGYCSIFERDLLLDVERGVVKSTRVRHNGSAAPDDTPVG
jgi:hypothetical protein